MDNWQIVNKVYNNMMYLCSFICSSFCLITGYVPDVAIWPGHKDPAKDTWLVSFKSKAAVLWLCLEECFKMWPKISAHYDVSTLKMTTWDPAPEWHNQWTSERGLLCSRPPWPRHILTVDVIAEWTVDIMPNRREVSSLTAAESFRITISELSNST